MQETAKSNLAGLARNPYPGRGIIVGLDETRECLVQVYWVMGRSENSRNRVFDYNMDEGRLFTTAADPAKVKDPSLIIYNAMVENVMLRVVSNGHQTDEVATRIIMKGESPQRIMRQWGYEPDNPNFTPRITAVSYWWSNKPIVWMSILRKSPWGKECERNLYEPPMIPGFGYCITTYSGDGDPLPSFQGDPVLLPLEGDAVRIAKTLFLGALNSDNKVAIAVKFIPKNGPSAISIINKYQKNSE